MFHYESTDKTALVPIGVEHPIVVIEINQIYVAGTLQQDLQQGFIGVCLDWTSTILRSIKAALITSSGKWTNGGIFIGNQLLIDEDYDKQRVCLGAFSTELHAAGERFELIFCIGDFQPVVPLPEFCQMERDWFRSPVVASADLQGILRSTTKANGLDLVFKEERVISPFGNCLYFVGSELAHFNVLNGYWLLRSRYVRKGLSLIVKKYLSHTLFWVMNHSAVIVELDVRVIQYVPLGPYNFERLANDGIYTTWSNHGQGYKRRVKDKKSKFQQE